MPVRGQTGLFPSPVALIKIAISVEAIAKTLPVGAWATRPNSTRRASA
jgi:hypothetical protein